MVTILLVILIIAAIGGAPGWGYHSFGWGPSGLVGLILLVLVVLLLLGRV